MMGDPSTQDTLWASESNRQDASVDATLEEMQHAGLSDDNDMDRQEMIYNYASDSYLQRWSQDLEDGKEVENTEEELCNQEQIDMKVVITEKNSVAEGTQLDVTADNDGISLVSYNYSVQDGKPAVVSRTATESSHCPYFLDVESQTASAWRGYGGNIYFNPLNCQSVRILTGKPVKKHPQKTSGKELHCGQGHIFHKKQEYELLQEGSLPTVNSGNMYVQSPIDSHLGSLRIDRTPRQRRCTSKLHYQQNQKGKLCKGRCEKIVLQTLQQRLTEPKRCVSAPEPLDLLGLRRQTRGSISESINDLKNFSKATSEEYELFGRNNFPVLFSSKKMVPRTNGCILESFSLPTLTNKVFENSITSSSGSIRNYPVTPELVQDSKPVLIIPFGAFDDPVTELDSDTSYSLKKKQTQEDLQKKTKSVMESNKTKSNVFCEKEMNRKKNANRTLVCHQTKPIIKSKGDEKRDFSKSFKLSKESGKEIPREVDIRVFVETSDDYGEPKTVAPRLSFENSSRCQNATNGKKYILKNPCHSRSKAKQPTTASLFRDNHLKREISNASLSSYLSAASSHTKQESNTKKTEVPKLSYTKRVKPQSVQSNNRYFDSRSNSLLNDKTKTNHSDFQADSVTFRCYEGRNSSNERSPSKQLKLILNFPEADNFHSTGGLQNLNKVETINSTSPKRSILKRTATSTKSSTSLGVKFSVDSPTASRTLMINGREYLVPVGNKIEYLTRRRDFRKARKGEL